jgi:hypothetical protein
MRPGFAAWFHRWMGPMNSAPPASRRSRAASISSTSNPATGHVLKWIWSLSDGPKTSTLLPSGNLNTMKSSSSWSTPSCNTSRKNVTSSEYRSVLVPTQLSPLIIASPPCLVAPMEFQHPTETVPALLATAYGVASADLPNVKGDLSKPSSPHFHPCRPTLMPTHPVEM